MKAVEKDSDIVVVVKISPRAYQTPTTPICQIEGTVSLVVKADVDFNGHTYLDVCDSLMTQFEIWQKCLEDAHEDFAVENRFQVAGFQLGSGQTSTDPDKVIWQYTHNFTLFGVVQ